LDKIFRAGAGRKSSGDREEAHLYLCFQILERFHAFSRIPVLTYEFWSSYKAVTDEGGGAAGDRRARSLISRDKRAYLPGVYAWVCVFWFCVVTG